MGSRAAFPESVSIRPLARRRLLDPELPDHPELALDRLLDAAEPLGDLGVGEALHLPDGDRAERLVAQACEEPLALLDDLRRERRGGLGVEDEVELHPL